MHPLGLGDDQEVPDDLKKSLNLVNGRRFRDSYHKLGGNKRRHLVKLKQI